MNPFLRARFMSFALSCVLGTCYWKSLKAGRNFLLFDEVLFMFYISYNILVIIIMYLHLYIHLSLNVAQKLVHILELDFDKRVYTKSTHVFEAYILCFRETRNDELQWKTYIAAYIALFSSLTDLPLSTLSDT